MKKEVTKSKKEVTKKDCKLLVFKAIQNGLISKQIRKKYHIPNYTLYYYYRLLKKENAIKKIGYGIYETTQKEVTKVHIEHSKFVCPQLTIRSHAFGFYLKLPFINNWNNREQFFIGKSIRYRQSTLNNVQAQRIIYKDFYVTFFNRGIKFLSVKQKNEFLTNSAKTGKELAVSRVLEAIRGLESLLKVSFEINRHYQIKVTRQHHAHIRNELAKLYNESNRKLKIYDEKGLWLLIDRSLNIDELETIRGTTADLDMDKALMPFFNDLKENPTTITAVRIENQQNFKDFSEQVLKPLTEQLKLHLAVEQSQDVNMKKMNKNQDKMNIMLNRINKKLRKG